jgi:hypothetical protein
MRDPQHISLDMILTFYSNKRTLAAAVAVMVAATVHLQTTMVIGHTPNNYIHKLRDNKHKARTQVLLHQVKMTLTQHASQHLTE